MGFKLTDTEIQEINKKIESLEKHSLSEEAIVSSIYSDLVAKYADTQSDDDIGDVVEEIFSAKNVAYHLNAFTEALQGKDPDNLSDKDKAEILHALFGNGIGDDDNEYDEDDDYDEDDEEDDDEDNNLKIFNIEYLRDKNYAFYDAYFPAGFYQSYNRLDLNQSDEELGKWFRDFIVNHAKERK